MSTRSLVCTAIIASCFVITTAAASGEDAQGVSSVLIPVLPKPDNNGDWVLSVDQGTGKLEWKKDSECRMSCTSQDDGFIRPYSPETTTNRLPGSREYYETYVKGRYILKNGKMEQFYAPSLHVRVAQMLNSTNLMMECLTTDALGIVDSPPFILALTSATNYVPGQEFIVKAIQTGRASCVMASGETNTVRVFSLPETITFEQ